MSYAANSRLVVRCHQGKIKTEDSHDSLSDKVWVDSQRIHKKIRELNCYLNLWALCYTTSRRKSHLLGRTEGVRYRESESRLKLTLQVPVVLVRLQRLTTQGKRATDEKKVLEKQLTQTREDVKALIKLLTNAQFSIAEGELTLGAVDARLALEDY